MTTEIYKIMPSTINGVVSKIIVKEGETVELDAILAILEEPGYVQTYFRYYGRCVCVGKGGTHTGG